MIKDGYSKLIMFEKAQKLFDELLFQLPCFSNYTEITLKPLLPSNHNLTQEYICHFPHQAIRYKTHNDSNVSGLLSPACCYPLFLLLSNNSIITEQKITIKSFVFRNEDVYKEWEREDAFLVRDFVFISEKGKVKHWIDQVASQVLRLFNLLELDVTKQEAQDYFYYTNSIESQIQAFYKLKHEFVVNELAIGSLNNHMNSFGRKCNIVLNEYPAYSACFGLGYHRTWNMLTKKHGIQDSLLMLQDLKKNLIEHFTT